MDSARPVTVLGWQTADRLFGTNVDPIDKIIQIEGVHFRVVGVSEKKGTVLGQSQDSFALIPLVWFTSRRDLMGPLVNRRATTVAAVLVAALISALNVFLLGQTFFG